MSSKKLRNKECNNSICTYQLKEYILAKKTNAWKQRLLSWQLGLSLVEP